jgi:hypothetical protein
MKRNHATASVATTTTTTTPRFWKTGHEGQRHLGLWTEVAFAERIDKTRKGTDMSRQRFMRLMIEKGLDQFDAERMSKSNSSRRSSGDSKNDYQEG